MLIFYFALPGPMVQLRLTTQTHSVNVANSGSRAGSVVRISDDALNSDVVSQFRMAIGGSGWIFW